jgi:poly-beta-hydroxyalkanoate depolymerase
MEGGLHAAVKRQYYFRHLVEDGNDDLEEQKQREFYSNYQINRNLSYIKTIRIIVFLFFLLTVII